MTVKNSRLSRTWLKDNWFIVVLVLAVLLIALYVARFYMTHRKVPDEPRYQLTNEAMRNRFFAAQLLLENQDKDVIVTKGEVAHQGLKQVWQQPPSIAKNSAVLLLTVSKSQEPDISAMLDWVKRGGHLITFSNTTLLPTGKNGETSEGESEADALAQYQINENALLNHLDIQNQQNEDPHDFIRNMMNQRVEDNVANNPRSSTPNVTKPSDIDLSTKALLRLPVLNTNGTQLSGDSIGIIMNTDHTKHLKTDTFYQKNPEAKPIADYRWFNFDPKKAISKQNLSILPMQNMMDSTLVNTLLTTLGSRPQDYLPADEAVLDVKFGNGRLTVLNDDNVFGNPDGNNLTTKPTATGWQRLKTSGQYLPSLDSLDNAYLLQYLVATRDKVWLVPDIEVANLPTLLWRHLKWACLAFAIALLATWLALPKRFGRIRDYQTDSQTNIFGYFNHVGQYLWHSDQARALVNDNREQLLERIVTRYPQLASHGIETNIWQRVDKAKICEVVADEVGISRGGVAVALFEDWQNERGFLQMSREFAKLTQYYHIS